MSDPRMELERSFTQKVFDALRTWLSKVRGLVMAPWRTRQARPDATAVAQAKPLWIRLVDDLQGELRIAARLGWSETAANIPIPADEQHIEQQLATSYRLMVGISDEVQAEILEEIRRATNDGNTPAQIAARVDALLDANGAARWHNRAKVIAATEVHRAANAGVQAAGMAISRMESVRLNKRWVTRHDDRVRTTHRDADQQVVPLNSRFKVGSSRMLYPGDPTAPAEEVVNCRCSMRVEDTS